MISKNNEDIIWVGPQAAGKGLGTFDSPFDDPGKAIRRARPGQTVVFKPGKYSGDLTIEHSGTIEHPIKIVAEKAGAAEIVNSCWYFYDVSDFVLSNLVFRDAPYGAISILGASKRNCLRGLEFSNCGKSKKTASTVLLGGCGSECNIVEDCIFIRNETDNRGILTAENASIGLMITEGDDDTGTVINKDFIVRMNTFRNYAYGIMVGAGETTTKQYGHVVEYNTIEHCIADGIHVACGDTRVRGNRLTNIKRHAVSITAGMSSVVDDNRIADSADGMYLGDKAHTVANNCFIRCSRHGVHVFTKEDATPAAKTAIVIENNTFVDCGQRVKTNTSVEKAGRSIRIESGVSCVVQRNLLYGVAGSIKLAGEPRPEMRKLAKTKEPMACFIQDNLVVDAAQSPNALPGGEELFCGYGSDNFENPSGYGASGWMLSPEKYTENPDDRVPLTDGEESESAEDSPPDREHEVEDLLEGVDKENVFVRSFLEGFYKDELLPDEIVEDASLDQS